MYRYPSHLILPVVSRLPTVSGLKLGPEAKHDIFAELFKAKLAISKKATAAAATELEDS